MAPIYYDDENICGGESKRGGKMEKKREDLLEVVKMNLGEDLPDVDIDEISGVTFDGKESDKARGISARIRPFIRGFRILVFGVDKDVRYPISERLRMIGILVGGFITVAATESIIATYLSRHGLTSLAELSLRVWTRGLILTLVNSLQSAVLFLLDAKFLSLVLGLVLLYLLSKRRRLI